MPNHTEGKRGLSLAQLQADVRQGDIDTVIVAITDMQGRLVGKKIHARFFLDEIAANGAEACSYLLAVDVDMNTVDGYDISSWESGYSDFVMMPDLSTLRYIPWQAATAFVMADVLLADSSPVSVSPRQILKRQLQRLGESDLSALCATELEFIVFDNSFEDAWKRGYRDLTPANLYNVDYSIIGVSRIESLLREIRLSMVGANMEVESVKGECNLGQHEIVFRYDDPLITCDNHVLFKTGAKEIASKHSKSLTFMAKVNEREGSSCHTHLSIRGVDQTLRMVDSNDSGRLSEFGESFLAGQLEHLRELTLLMAPNINSYKRFVSGSFAPTAIAWGRDNRTCAMRLIGKGKGLRIENRVPGGDANPFLVVSAMIAAGLDGVERGLKLPDEFIGNAYVGDSKRVPSTLLEARDLFAESEFCRGAFGEDVVKHYTNMADVELAAFSKVVTDWELVRSFERM